MEERNNRAVAGAMMLIAGGVIGAGLALLYAPQSGEKTRRQINRYARRAANNAEETIRDAADAVTDMVEDLNVKTSDLLEQGQDVAEDWRKHLLQSLERGQKGLEKQRRKLAQIWS